MPKSINKSFLLLILCVVINLSGCSVRAIKVPVDDRITCSIAPLKDLTGSYDPVEPKLETILKEESKGYFANYEHQGRTASEDKTIYVTNHFILNELAHSSNDKMEVERYLNEAPKSDLLITGNVQQLKYGKPSEIAKYFVDAWLFGILGVLEREKAERTSIIRAALAEYNFKVFNTKTKKEIASFTIQGAAELAERDRERIVALANEKAAQGLLVRLNTEVAKIYKNIEPKKYYRIGENYYKW